MSIEQIMLFIGTFLGGGGFAAAITGWVARSNAKTTATNEAKRDVSSAWDAIVENLQLQINTQTTNFTQQLTALHTEVSSLKIRQGELEERLGYKERLVLKAIAHIGKLEAHIPQEKIIPRPEGLE